MAATQRSDAGVLLNIYCYYGAGLQVCDRRPSVRRVIRPTMKTRYDKIRLQNGVLSVASTRPCYLDYHILQPR
jgi:hypothetical protein